MAEGKRMGKGRIEAFSDGVIAIIITIMVLELKVQHGETLEAILPLYPVFLSYVLSFIHVGIYWNNHHHMFHAVSNVRGSVLWANMHLLFWLSLVPFTTGFMGENHFASFPVALYGLNLGLCGVAYSILVRLLIRHHGRDSEFSRAIGNDRKGNLSILLYGIGIPMAFFAPLVSLLLYSAVAAIWLIPDRRFERLAAE